MESAHMTDLKSPQSELGTGAPLPVPTETPGPLTTLRTEQPTDSTATSDKQSTLTTQPIAASHVRFSDEAHSYLREYIRNADQKATFFFAILTAILAYLNAQNAPSRWLKNPQLWSLIDFLAFLSMFGLAVGAGVLLSVVFPRLKGSRRGLFFFSAIAEYDTSREYASDILACSEHDLVRTKLNHCYDLAKICTAKYRALCAGFWIGCIGVMAALIFLLFSKSSGPTP